MKKIKSLISLATLFGVMGLCAQAAPVELEGIDGGSTDTYMVAVNGEAGTESANRTTQSVINQIGYLFDHDDYTIKYVYDTVYNGFAITTTSAVAEAIRGLSNVASVNVEHTYAAPEDVETDGVDSGISSADNGYLEEKLGNYSKETVHATDSEIKSATGNDSVAAGSGIKIGIIDTGLFLNQVEGTDARQKVENNYSGLVNKAAFKTLATADAMTDEETTAFKALIDSKTPANSSTSYINNKVIYTWDYNGNDSNVVPNDDGGEHGTHVASLAAANGDDFQGIAPNAQLAILKVFPDDASGASTSNIVAALEDAADLQLDVVNLSLGTDLLDDSESLDDDVYKALVKCEEAGVIVNYAAGNSGKSSYGSGNSYYDWTTDTAETSIIGSSSTLDEKANIVASTNPDKAFYEEVMLVQAEGASSASAVAYSDQAVSNSNTQYDEEHPMLELLDKGQSEFDYVYIPGYGATSDYDGYDVNGKIVVVDRGDLTFTNKVSIATDQGAIAVIVVNNVDGNTFNFTFDFSDYEPSIPVCWIFKSTASAFGEHCSTGTVTLAQNEVQEASDGGSFSSFSSDGPGANLDLIPTVAAPGNEVIGAISAFMTGDESGLYGYDNPSGTSMATPNFTGAIASILSEHTGDEDYETYKQEVSMLAMSTADPIYDSSKENIASPRIQGAGQVNVADALKSDTIVYTTTADDEFNITERKQTKAELKNKGELFTDLSQDDEAYIEFTYSVKNNSSETRTYTPSVSLMIPNLNVGTNGSDYDSDVENGSASEVPDTLVNAVTVSVNDEELDISDRQPTGTISVNAGETVSASVKIRIDDIQIDKTFDDAQSENKDFPEVEDFHGTLREYYNKYYNGEEGAGGGYVEGFLTLTDTTGNATDLSMPYMGFYGDYTKGEAVEPFDFEKQDGHLYTSDMVDKYVQNLTSSYALPNAYSSSTLSATGSSLTSSAVGNIAGLQQSAQAGQGSFVTVEGDDDRLYAGATGVSDHLHAFFFVNRSISDSGWSLTNSSGTAVGSGKIGAYCATYGQVSGSGDLYKSWVHASSSYDLYRGYAEIDLTKVEEGEYTLSFWFTLRGAGASDGTNTTQTSSYTLVVDRTSPDIQSVDIEYVDGKKILTAVTKGGNEATSLLQTGTATAVTSLGNDEYQTEIDVSRYDYVTLQFADFAHNYTYATYHTDDLSVYFSTNESGLVRTSNFDWARIGNGVYEFTYLTGSSQNSGKTPVDIQLHLYAGTGLDLEPDVYVDGEYAEATYDATTGYVTITIPAGTEVASVDINFEVQSLAIEEEPDDDNTSDEPGEEPDDDNTGDDNTSDDNEESTGLGTGAIVGITVGSVAGVAVVGGGITLGVRHSKKKKASK